nr:unnamed protein product [Digitaria exilis]
MLHLKLETKVLPWIHGPASVLIGLKLHRRVRHNGGGNRAGGCVGGEGGSGRGWVGERERRG